MASSWRLRRNLFDSRHLGVIRKKAASLIWARSRSTGPARPGRRCRRPRAKGPRTTGGDGRAGVGWRAEASVIAVAGANLAAKHQIGPGGVAEDQRDQDGDADQHEELAVLRRGGLPDRDALRYDIGIHADAEP